MKGICEPTQEGLTWSAVFEDRFEPTASVLAATSSGDIYQAFTDTAWTVWSFVGALPDVSSVVDCTQAPGGLSADFVCVSNDGRVWEFDPRRIDEANLRTDAAPTDFVAVFPDRFEETSSVLAVTGVGDVYQASTTDAWVSWTFMGALPGGSDVVDCTQSPQAASADFVCASDDGRIWEFDPRRIDEAKLRTEAAPAGFVACGEDRWQEISAVLCVTGEGEIYQAFTTDAWVTWTLVGKLPHVPLVLQATGGPCPGLISVSVSGGSPNGQVGFIASASLGSDTVPSGPCTGTPLDILSPTPLTSVAVDADGDFGIDVEVPAGACGMFLQALDLSTCNTSAAEPVP